MRRAHLAAGLQRLWFWESGAVLCCCDVTRSLLQGRKMVRGDRGKGGRELTMINCDLRVMYIRQYAALHPTQSFSLALCEKSHIQHFTVVILNLACLCCGTVRGTAHMSSACFVCYVLNSKVSKEKCSGIKSGKWKYVVTHLFQSNTGDEKS